MDAMPSLGIIIASTRPGRIGLPVADWFIAAAREHGGFEITVLDLAEINLPFVDEPSHPRLRAYTHSTPSAGAPSSTALTRSS
jgi:NAD(P)H-dependent FMN reductase